MRKAARSLRFRLVAAAVLTAVVGMVVVNVVAVVVLRDYLLRQVDEQLMSVPFGRPNGGPPTSSTPPVRNLSDNQFLDDRAIVRLDAVTGDVTDSLVGPGLGQAPGPDVADVQSLIRQGALQDQLITLADASGTSDAYRARVIPPPATSGRSEVVVVARSLSSVTSTVHRVALVDAVVSAVLLLLLAAIGGLLVRVGLRPLSDVERAAEDIAAGDLEARAPHADEASEVGSLSRAFNGMVDAVTGALSARDESEQQLRRFLADASHELRTPLTAIRAWAELYRQGAVEGAEETAAAMARIEADAARMGVLVDDLLLLARLDQEPALRVEPVDVGGVAAEVIAGVAAGAPQHVVTVERDEGAPSLAAADAEAVRRVLANLVRNAVIHTPSGTRVVVDVARVGDEVRVAVVDDGDGLHEVDASHVFDRFYRPDAGRSRTVAGSGLGLAIVRSLTEAQGGRVSLVTAPGAGCAFTIVLPAWLEPEPQATFLEPAGNLQMRDRVPNA